MTPPTLLLCLSLLFIISCRSEHHTNIGVESSPPTRKTISVLGPMTGEQQRKLEATFAPFVAQTGIDVVYQGTDAFTTLLNVRVEADDAPDIAILPQPGLMADFARKGKLVPLEQFMDLSALQKAYSQDWLNLATVKGHVYGLWYRASVKSLVWYSPKAFKAAGYSVPNTWAELQSLSDQIVADGGVPWCLGMESGDATGWVGTDWIEDILLRTAGPQVYDQWVKHEIPFRHPAIKEAFERFGEIALNPQYVVGGSMGVISIPFSSSPNGLFRNPPRCYLHRQASFITNFFPEGVVLGRDVDFFPLPPIQEEFGLPILVGGDVIVMFRDTPETRKFMEYFSTKQPHEIGAGLGGYISPHQQVSLQAYPNSITRRQAEILMNAETVRFDASDMMPGNIGTGVFWADVVDYVAGEDVDTVLMNLDQNWPQEPRF